MADIEATFVLEEQPGIQADFNIAVVNKDHNVLINRDLPNQHPMSAITGLETALSGKQDIISDLLDIRSGSALGATALQPNDNISELVNNAGYITSSALEPYVLSSSLATVATTGNYNDLTNKPTIPTDTSDLTNGAGFITSADLSGYATETWVGNQGYITGITSSDVTTALGYTPYNSTNPSGYITSAALTGYATESYVNTADNNLQTQIDAITSASDVTDIVGTYAELQAYDTTSLPNNSIIKVLQDESRDDETTYYRWVITGGVGAWSLIGEEGPYYTKAQADAAFVPQTRTINGKALSADISLSASDVGALPSSTVIPTVNDATLTIQKNGTTVKTFTANASANVTANITVPTDTSDLTNTAGYITSSALSPYALSSSLATVATSGSYNDLSNKPTIPTVNNATLTIQKNGTTVNTFTANASSNVTANITVPTKVSDLTNDSGYITGITSSDVTTALGYTPYDASNPSGYTSNVGTVTSVNNVSPVSGNVTLAIPTVNNAALTITQGGVSKGTFTANASSDVTIALDAGGSAYTAGDGIDITSNVISVDGVQTSEVTLATVATTGAYSDLSGTPSLSGYQTTANLVTSISSSSTDSQYPSAKCIYDIIGDVETLLSQV